MSLGTWLFIALVAWGALILAFERRRSAIRRATAPPPARDHYPSLSVIHPVRGLDPGFADNVAAALAVDYRGQIEDIFVFDDDDEPGLPAVRAAIAELEAKGHAGRARVLIAGPPRPGLTGKISAMSAGLTVARGDLIAFADSDIRVDRDIVRILVDLLLDDPMAGSAFAPVVVTEPARSAGDVGYQIMLNSLYSPEVALWNQRGKPMTFIMGQLMVFRRSTLDAIGSVECARGQLVDDMHIGTHVAAAGLRNVMTSRPIRIIEWGLGFSEFARNARRWLVFSRSGIPGSFAVGAAFHFVGFWIGMLGLYAGLSHAWAPVALIGAGLMLATSAEVLALNRATGGSPTPVRWWWMAPFMLLAGPFLYVTTWIWPEVRWRGRLYGLNARGELDTGPVPLAGKIRRALRVEGF